MDGRSFRGLVKRFWFRRYGCAFLFIAFFQRRQSMIVVLNCTVVSLNKCNLNGRYLPIDFSRCMEVIKIFTRMILLRRFLPGYFRRVANEFRKVFYQQQFFFLGTAVLQLTFSRSGKLDKTDIINVDFSKKRILNTRSLQILLIVFKRPSS